MAQNYIFVKPFHFFMIFLDYTHIMVNVLMLEP